MSDTSQWESPGGQTPPPPPQYPTFGAPVGGPPPLAPPAWAPPPKPGLIPLRPLGLGDILGASFKVLRRNPRPVVGVSLVIKGIVAIITIGTMGLLSVLLFANAINAISPEAAQIGLGNLAQTQATSVVTLILGIVADAILQGIITLEVARGTLGEKLPFSALWRRARGRIWPLIGWSLALGGALILVFLIVGVLLVVLAVSGGVTGTVIAVLLGIVAGLGGIAIGLWLGTKLSLVPSVLLLERATLGVAIKRSWQLTRRYFWRTLGIELLVAVIVSVAAGVVVTPVTFIITLVTFSTQTSVTAAGGVPQVSFLAFVVTTVVSALVSAITAIVSTSADALIYIDLRIRKEGLDLDLLRFVEARDTGAEVADPYLAKAAPEAATATPAASAAAADSPWA